MPTYGYRCTVCQHEFERFQKITDEPIRVCEKCGAPVKKILYPVGIAFKGEGFHVNDYKKDSRKSTTAAEPKTETTPATATAETKAETKPETKTETKASESPSSTKDSSG